MPRITILNREIWISSTDPEFVNRIGHFRYHDSETIGIISQFDVEILRTIQEVNELILYTSHLLNSYSLVKMVIKKIRNVDEISNKFLHEDYKIILYPPFIAITMGRFSVALERRGE